MATKYTRSLSESISGGLETWSNSLGKAYKALTPSVWTGDYPAEAWQDWYAKSAKPSSDVDMTVYGEFATPETLDRLYEGWDSHRLHQEWMQRALPKLNALFREFSTTLKPEEKSALTLQPIDESLDSESINRIAARNEAIKQTLRDVRASILGLPNSADKTQAGQLRDEFLGWLKETSLNGSMRSDNSVTPEQYAEWRADPNDAKRVNAHYRLNEEGQRQLDRLADYNLLTTFQTSLHHRPSFLKSGGIMGAIGNTLSMATAPVWGDISMVPQQNLRALVRGNPKSTVVAALTQDDYTRNWRKTNPEFAKGVWAGAAVPQLSAADPDGMDFAFSSPSTLLGAAAQYPTNYLLLSGLTTGQQRGDLISAGRKLDRVSPIIEQDPSGAVSRQAQFERARALDSKHGDIQRDAWRGFSDYLPAKIYALNDLLGAPKDKPYIKPFYPSAFVNDAVMAIPGMLGDPQNLASMAAGGFGALLSKGSRIAQLLAMLGHQAKEAPFEAAFNTGQSIAQNPQSINQYFTAPDPNVTLRTRDGRIPDPSKREEYFQAVADRDQQAQTDLRATREWLNTQSQYAKQKPASGGSKPPFRVPFVVPWR